MTQSLEAAARALEIIASGFELEPEWHAAEAPDWAKDSFNHDSTDQCGYCGAWCEVVRPGKTQCPCCGDGRDKAAIAAAALRVLFTPARDSEGEAHRYVRSDGWWSDDGLAWYNPAPNAAQPAHFFGHVVNAAAPPLDATGCRALVPVDRLEFESLRARVDALENTVDRLNHAR